MNLIQLLAQQLESVKSSARQVGFATTLTLLVTACATQQQQTYDAGV